MGFTNIRDFLTPRDYWSMDDKKLELIAIRYHIDTMGKDKEGSSTHFMRQDVIDALVARDTARRTGVVVLATIVSMLSIVVNIIIVLASTFTQSPPAGN